MNSEKNERYLFRGKRIDNGEWISGYLWKNNKKSYISNDAVELMVVDSATVGQCTGLRDGNGTLIFEGDILHPEDWEPAPVVWKLSGWMLDYPDYYEPIDDIPDARIVGNIHDNPELIRRT